MRRITPLFICVALLLVTLTGCIEYSERYRTSPLHRVAVIGASVTAGFKLTTPPIKGDLGAYPINMKHIVEGMISVPHEEVAYFGKLAFFARPDANGAVLIDELIAYEPSLVVAIDVLFWYAYGGTRNATDPVQYRKEKFERGLALLEKIDAPIILGNLPDMHKAVGTMLSARQVPSVETIHALNIRVREWAKDNPNVFLVDLHRVVTNLMNDAQIQVFGHTWPAGSQSTLLQADLLHPTFEGTVGISLLIAEALGGAGLETNLGVLMDNAAAEARKQAHR